MAKSLMLNDILRFNTEQIANAKIALHISAGRGGRNYFEQWQNDNRQPEEKDVDFIYWSHYSEKQRNFHEGNICVGFVQTNSHTQWLLVAVGRIITVPASAGICKYEPLHEYDALLGRVIIRLSKGNKMGRYDFNLSKYLNQCVVVKVCEEPYRDDKSFSLDSISLSYKELKETLDGVRNPALKKILENIKGVYCLTDTHTGLLYIGSATSEGKGVAQRWSNYAETKTGGNKKFIKLIEEKGEQYFIDYFRFTVLEYYGMRFDDSKILERERYWKDALDTIEHGYNANR